MEPEAHGSAVDANAAMRKVWDGEVGSFWVEETTRYERMNSAFGERLIAAAVPQSDERFLDVGCGHGARSLDLARSVGSAGQVVGVDISGPMLEVAKRRAETEDLAQVTFRSADAQTADLGDGRFDGVVSQFGVMFFSDAQAAFSNLRRAVTHGGRLAFTCWQDLGQQQRIMVPVEAALKHVPVPDFDETSWANAAFSLADPDRIHALLRAAGFSSISIEPLVLPEYQGSDVPDVIAFFQRTELAENLFSRADPEQSARGWEAVSTALQPFVTPDGVYLDGAAWLVTAQT